jgi:hypothetical protein
MSGCGPSFESQLLNVSEAGVAWTQKPVMSGTTLLQYKRLVNSGNVPTTNRRHAMQSYGEIYRDRFKNQTNTATQFRANLPGLQ